MNKPLPAPSRLLVASPWVYHPHCGIGGGVFCFGVLKALARVHDIHWLSFDQTANDLEGGKAALAEICRTVTTIPVPPPKSKLLRRLRELSHGIPSEVQSLQTPEMLDVLRRIVADRKISLVIPQFPQMAQLLGEVDVPMLMDVQDACMVSRYRQWQATAISPPRPKAMMDWIAWFRYESKQYAKASALLALNENELGVLRSFVPGVPTYLSPVSTQSVSAVRAPVGGRVVFVGNFSHGPNADGLNWLLRKIWPLVRARYPAATLSIAGPNCPEPPADAGCHGVTKLGFVEDFAALLSSATVSIVPYRFGGGTKIKALETLAHGCPLVTTGIGAEGLSLVDGETALIADEAHSFADAIVRCMKAPSEAEEMGARGQEHIRMNFSVDAKVAGLAGIIDALVGGKILSREQEN